ncbi:hypothetical protein M5362_04570 [Streptomyces sp. Je 1-79]|uniref:hypothetical protein n=1 Tax=Streptomyces sp. Je 1-79 TaxID=2943847 RepID=UPI0021A76931|nr:hypothetical protein [Streptomyces sp. Je 1-79]MCT4352407.1 hypothetical protein [Streptomyces sp. Je 1-79]
MNDPQNQNGGLGGQRQRDGREHGQGQRGGRDGREQGRREKSAGPLIREVPPPYKRTSGAVAAVLLYRNGGHRVMWPDRTEDTNKPMLGSPYTVFEVRTGRHVTEFELALPASGDGVFFKAAARVLWEVADPYLVVSQQVWNVAELLRDDLLDGLRAVSRRFRLTDAQRADEAVRDELSSGRFSLGEDLGLRARVLVFIDLDDTIKEEIGKRDLVSVSMQVDEREIEQRRVKELGERRLVAERARDLEELFRRGDLAQIAHHMAMNPDKQWDIRRELQQEKREGQADFLAVFNRLLDTGVLERHDIGEPMYQVLEFLRESTGTVLGGVAGHVLTPPGPGRRRAALEGGARPEPVLPPWHDDTRDGRGGREGREGRDSGDEDTRARRGPSGSRETRDSREPRDSRGSGEPRGFGDTRSDDARESRDGGGRESGREPSWEDAEHEEERPVYEPTRVQSSSERDRDDRARRRYSDFEERDYDDRRFDDRFRDDRFRDDRDRGPSSRPSSDFDDWDTE